MAKVVKDEGYEVARPGTLAERIVIANYGDKSYEGDLEPVDRREYTALEFGTDNWGREGVKELDSLDG